MDTDEDPRNPHATPAENARFAAFAAHLSEAGLSPITRACYASDWWNVSEQAHAATGRRFRLDRFGADDFRLQRAALAAKGTAPSTLNRRLAFLRRYSAFAAGADRTLREIAAGLAAVPFQAVERRTNKALTNAQERALVAAADELGTQDAAIVSLLLGTGLRSSEAAALRRADVVGALAAPTAVRVQGPPAKTVLLAPRARDRMAAHLAATPGRPEDEVFRARHRGAAGEEGITAAVERAAARAGVSATARTLRHTFSVRYLSEHRDDIEGLARALGHLSLAPARSYRTEAAAGPPAPGVVKWSDLEEATPVAGVRRRAFLGKALGAEREVIAPGTRTASHAHPEEQVTFVLSGRVTFDVGGRKLEAGAGEFVHVPGGSVHGIAVGRDRPALVLHVYSPPPRMREGAGA